MCVTTKLESTGCCCAFTESEDTFLAVGNRQFVCAFIWGLHVSIHFTQYVSQHLVRVILIKKPRTREVGWLFNWLLDYSNEKTHNVLRHPEFAVCRFVFFSLIFATILPKQRRLGIRQINYLLTWLQLPWWASDTIAPQLFQWYVGIGCLNVQCIRMSVYPSSKFLFPKLHESALPIKSQFHGREMAVHWSVNCHLCDFSKIIFRVDPFLFRDLLQLTLEIYFFPFLWEKRSRMLCSLFWAFIAADPAGW